MATTTTRPRRRQRQRHDPLAAGSPRAVDVVRGYIAGERRRQQHDEGWKAIMRARETYTRKRFV